MDDRQASRGGSWKSRLHLHAAWFQSSKLGTCYLLQGLAAEVLG